MLQRPLKALIGTTFGCSVAILLDTNEFRLESITGTRNDFGGLCSPGNIRHGNKFHSPPLKDRPLPPIAGGLTNEDSRCTAAAQAHLPAWPRPTAAALYRMAGLLIAVGVPTLFWTFALVLATKGAGIAIGGAGAGGLRPVVAAWCLVGASLVMGNRD